MVILSYLVHSSFKGKRPQKSSEIESLVFKEIKRDDRTRCQVWWPRRISFRFFLSSVMSSIKAASLTGRWKKLWVATVGCVDGENCAQKWRITSVELNRPTFSCISLSPILKSFVPIWTTLTELGGDPSLQKNISFFGLAAVIHQLGPPNFHVKFMECRHEFAGIISYRINSVDPPKTYQHAQCSFPDSSLFNPCLQLGTHGYPQTHQNAWFHKNDWVCVPHISFKLRVKLPPYCPPTTTSTLTLQSKWISIFSDVSTGNKQLTTSHPIPDWTHLHPRFRDFHPFLGLEDSPPVLDRAASWLTGECVATPRPWPRRCFWTLRRHHSLKNRRNRWSSSAKMMQQCEFAQEILKTSPAKMWTFEGEVWVLNHQKEKFFQQQSSLTQRGLNHVESPNEFWNQLPTEADCRPWGERVQGWTLGLNVPSRDFVGLRKNRNDSQGS